MLRQILFIHYFSKTISVISFNQIKVELLKANMLFTEIFSIPLKYTHKSLHSLSVQLITTEMTQIYHKTP